MSPIVNILAAAAEHRHSPLLDLLLAQALCRLLRSCAGTGGLIGWPAVGCRRERCGRVDLGRISRCPSGLGHWMSVDIFCR